MERMNVIVGAVLRWVDLYVEYDARFGEGQVQVDLYVRRGRHCFASNCLAPQLYPLP